MKWSKLFLLGLSVFLLLAGCERRLTSIHLGYTWLNTGQAGEHTESLEGWAPHMMTFKGDTLLCFQKDGGLLTHPFSLESDAAVFAFGDTLQLFLVDDTTLEAGGQRFIREGYGDVDRLQVFALPSVPESINLTDYTSRRKVPTRSFLLGMSQEGREPSILDEHGLQSLDDFLADFPVENNLVPVLGVDPGLEIRHVYRLLHQIRRSGGPYKILVQSSSSGTQPWLADQIVPINLRSWSEPEERHYYPESDREFAVPASAGFSQIEHMDWSGISCTRIHLAWDDSLRVAGRAINEEDLAGIARSLWSSDPNHLVLLTVSGSTRYGRWLRIRTALALASRDHGRETGTRPMWLELPFNDYQNFWRPYLPCKYY